MTTDPAELSQLREDLQRLHATVARWSVTRWSAPVGGDRTKADVLFALLIDLAVLGARAGSGAPPDSWPPRLDAYVLADQLAVLGAELLAAPRAAVVADDAEAALAAARQLLLS